MSYIDKMSYSDIVAYFCLFVLALVIIRLLINSIQCDYYEYYNAYEARKAYEHRQQGLKYIREGFKKAAYESFEKAVKLHPYKSKYKDDFDNLKRYIEIDKINLDEKQRRF